MKKGLIKSITAFLQKIVGVLYREADKRADSVVLAIEWLQGVLEGNEEKAKEAVSKTKNKVDDTILKVTINYLPSILKGVKEVDGLVNGSEDSEELFEKLKGKVILEATEKRKFYTDLAATLLIKFVPVPYWVAVILTQFAFGKIFKS